MDICINLELTELTETARLIKVEPECPWRRHILFFIFYLNYENTRGLLCTLKYY